MEKPLSVIISDQIKDKQFDLAINQATQAANSYPAIKLYKRLLKDAQYAKLLHTQPNSTVNASSGNEKEIYDLESINYHLGSSIDECINNGKSPSSEWLKIMALMPNSWPKDPRLTKILTPSDGDVDKLLNRGRKALLIVCGEKGGGAGIAAYRLFRALCKSELAVDILYRESADVIVLEEDGGAKHQFTWLDYTQSLYPGVRLDLLEQMRSLINNEVHKIYHEKAIGSNTFLYHTETTVNLEKLIGCYDGINIHWSDFLLSTPSLELIRRVDKPVTITLHDMYWLSGCCHYSAGCSQVITGCNACPLVTGSSDIINSYNEYHVGVLNDLTDLEVIAPSEWLCNLARESRAFKSRNVYLVENPQTAKATQELEVSNPNSSNPMAKMKIVYGAIGLDERRKGFELFEKLARHLDKKNANVDFLIFGRLRDDQSKALLSYSNCKVVGFLNHEELHATFTNSDALLLITHEDNYPNLCVEAAAAGLPIIGSNNSGVGTFIRNTKGGILFDNTIEAVAEAISELDSENKRVFSSNIKHWYASTYSDASREKMYATICTRPSAQRKETVAIAKTHSQHGITGNSQKYIRRASAFAVELEIHGYSDILQSHTFDMCIVSSSSANSFQLYIDGVLSSSKPNKTGNTEFYNGLHQGSYKISSVAQDSYSYNEIDIDSISILANDLCSCQLDRMPSVNAPSMHTKILPLVITNDDLIVEEWDKQAIWWLLGGAKYNLSIPTTQATPAYAESFQHAHVCFRCLDLRAFPVSKSTLRVQTTEDTFEYSPIIEEDQFYFSLPCDIFNTSDLVLSLFTAEGEYLDDGRQVVALVKSQLALFQV